MTDGVSLVVRAWLDEGCNPAYHRAMKRKLGREWPSLYSAVETLVREQMVKDCPCLECAMREMDESDRNRDFGTSGAEDSGDHTMNEECLRLRAQELVREFRLMRYRLVEIRRSQMSQRELADLLGRKKKWVVKMESYDYDPTLRELRIYALAVSADIQVTVTGVQ